MGVIHRQNIYYAIVSDKIAMDRIRTAKDRRRKIDSYIIAKCREKKMMLTGEEKAEIWMQIMDEI